MVAFWKSRYLSQNRPYLDKRTLNSSEKEAMIVAFTLSERTVTLVPPDWSMLTSRLGGGVFP